MSAPSPATRGAENSQLWIVGGGIAGIPDGSVNAAFPGRFTSAFS
jgi:hypothetical protein